MLIECREYFVKGYKKGKPVGSIYVLVQAASLNQQKS